MGNVSNTGTMAAEGGVLAIIKSVGGTGKLEIGATGTLSLLAGAGADQTVNFQAATGLLDLTHPNAFLGAIAGFGGGDKIDLLGTVAGTFNVNGNELQLSNGGATVASLKLNGSYTNADFALTSDQHGGTFISFV